MREEVQHHKQHLKQVDERKFISRKKFFRLNNTRLRMTPVFMSLSFFLENLKIWGKDITQLA